MVRGAYRKMSGLLVALAAFALPGCITIQAIEPVISPPASFKGDASVAVEFAQPGSIGFRCAERGAKFFGMPGINSGACADSQLVTMIDPCATVTAGPYARVLCDSLRLHRQETQAATDIAGARALAKAPVLTKIGFAQTPRTPVASVASAPSPWASVSIEFIAPAAVETRCAERGAKMLDVGDGFAGCGDRLRITISNPCDLEETGWYARTLCHEMAHVNGWPSDHPTHGPLATIRLASESPQALALAALQASSSNPIAVISARAADHHAHSDESLTMAAEMDAAAAQSARDEGKALEAKIRTMALFVRNAAEPLWMRAQNLLEGFGGKQRAQLAARVD